MENKNYYLEIQRYITVILIINVVVAIVRIVVGFMMKSETVIAGGYNAVADAMISVAGLVGAKLAARPKDRCHPYGYEKIEMLAGILIAALLLFMAGNVMLTAISKIKVPAIPQVDMLGIIIIFITLIINIVIERVEYAKGKQIGSALLISDAMQTRGDIYVTLGILGVLIGLKFGLHPVMDPIVSLVIAGFILHTAFEIFNINFVILLDRRAIGESKIEGVLADFSEVKSINLIRSRATSSHAYVDLDLEVDSAMSVAKAAKLRADISNKLSTLTHRVVSLMINFETNGISDDNGQMSDDENSQGKKDGKLKKKWHCECRL